MPPVTEMVFVVGPMDPATKRGLSGVLAASASRLASPAASRLMRRASCCSPYSASTTDVAPKVSVSRMSAPASR